MITGLQSHLFTCSLQDQHTNDQSEHAVIKSLKGTKNKKIVSLAAEMTNVVVVNNKSSIVFV